MKKLSIILGFILCAISCNYSKNPLYEGNFDGYIGSPKSVKKITHKAKIIFGEAKEEEEIDKMEIREYDANGHVLNNITYGSDGDVDCIYQYSYDDKGYLVSIKFKDGYYFSDTTDFEIIEKEENKIIRKQINQNGKLDTLVYNPAENTLTMTNGEMNMTYKYNCQNIVTNISAIFYNNNSKYSTEYEYKEDRYLTTYKENNRVVSYQYLSFDDNGNWTKRVKIDEDDVVVEVAEYTY